MPLNKQIFLFLIWININSTNASFCKWRSTRGVMANVLDCDMVINEFKLQSRNYDHFQTRTIGEKHEPSLSLLAMGQIKPLLSLYKDCLGIKSPKKVYIPLNKPS